MLNDKVILINAMTRSGSNMLWNIMQSHPRVCSPVGETNSVLHFPWAGLHRLSRFLYKHCRSAFMQRRIDRVLYQCKLDTIRHVDNRNRAEDQPYTQNDIETATLCLKAVNEDIYLTDLFCSMYTDIHIIGLVRNGYAVCEGMVRRGVAPAKVGRAYARFTGRIIEDSQRITPYRIVRFEDMVDQPFETAESLYGFCGLKPARPERLRLKIKRGAAVFGNSTIDKEAGGKRWFDRNNIAELVDVNVDSTQSSALTHRDRELFEKQARPVLEQLGYA